MRDSTWKGGTEIAKEKGRKEGLFIKAFCVSDEEADDENEDFDRKFHHTVK